MAENTAPAKCSEAMYEAARAAGLLIVTTGEELALQKFADTLQTAAYAEGRTDESKEMAGPLALMRDAFDLLESHLGDSEVEYEDDEEEREYAPVQVAARLLMGAIQAMRGLDPKEPA